MRDQECSRRAFYTIPQKEAHDTTPLSADAMSATAAGLMARGRTHMADGRDSGGDLNRLELNTALKSSLREASSKVVSRLVVWTPTSQEPIAAAGMHISTHQRKH